MKNSSISRSTRIFVTTSLRNLSLIIKLEKQVAHSLLVRKANKKIDGNLLELVVRQAVSFYSLPQFTSLCPHIWSVCTLFRTKQSLGSIRIQ